MKSNKIQLLVGTHSYLLFVTISDRFELEKVEVIQEGHHYGICQVMQTPSRFWVKGGGEWLTLLDLDTNRNGVRTSQINRIELDQDEFNHIHQILCRCEDEIFITNTKYNELVVIDRNSQVSKRLKFSQHRMDLNHLNSIYFLGNGMLALLLHNHSKLIRSEVVIVDCSDLKIISRTPVWHVGCHNVFIDQKTLLYNASVDGMFVAASYRENIIMLTHAFSGMHPKGMAVGEDMIVIGCSEHADRSVRYATKGKLIFLDRNNYDVMAEVQLKLPEVDTGLGNINEVRLVSAYDYSMHGSGTVS